MLAVVLLINQLIDMSFSFDEQILQETKGRMKKHKVPKAQSFEVGNILAITHLELSEECENILFTEEHLTDKVRDLLETITMQWDFYITNTIDSDRLTEGINLSHLS